MPDFTDCPVVDQAELASAIAKSLESTVRKLRRLQKRCSNCPNAGDCPALAHWRGHIDEAIRTVYAEWSATA